MAEVDFGALIKGTVGSFNQARDFSLAVAQNRLVAQDRIQRLELQRQQQAFGQEATLEGQRIAQEKLQFQIDEAKRIRDETEQKEADLEELTELTFPKPSGRDVTAGVAEGRRTDLETLGAERKAGRLRAKLFPEETFTARAGRKTEKQFFFDLVNNPDTPEAVRELAGRLLISGTQQIAFKKLDIINDPDSFTDQQRRDRGITVSKDKGVSTADVRLVWDEVSQFIDIENLSATQLTEEVNARGTQRHGEKWIPYTVREIIEAKGFFGDTIKTTLTPGVAPEDSVVFE